MRKRIEVEKHLAPKLIDGTMAFVYDYEMGSKDTHHGATSQACVQYCDACLSAPCSHPPSAWYLTPRRPTAKPPRKR